MSVALLVEPPVVTHEARITDAALRCIARWGGAKTTLEDIAREAGLSRATVYRVFPGGKDGLMETVAKSETRRFFAGVAAAMATADSLEDTLVHGMAEAGRRITTHEPLQFLLAHEPEVVLPRLAFGKLDEVLAAGAAVGAPYLESWLSPDEARRAGEWAARLVLSYVCQPADSQLDIADIASVRRLVRTFVLPGLTQPSRGTT
ncbi:MAG TPA: helix-turn-helix domain-containing protein [Acidimicrobiales bacterium]|nr:helix-turn-helix domain-containing protein [Acidimicrobiales bacterium]